MRHLEDSVSPYPTRSKYRLWRVCIVLILLGLL